MKNNNIFLSIENQGLNWITIKEAVKISKKLANIKIRSSDIYRNALCGNISLSIYFQSPIILRKVKTSNLKVKFRTTKNSITHRLCMLEKNCFLDERNLIVSTEGDYIIPTQRIIDTTLAGYEYVLIQRLLSHSLNISYPIIGAHDINHGISVSISGGIYQIFERVTWQERIKQQIMRLPENFASDIYHNASSQMINWHSHKDYFPLHNLPQDTCFVIRYSELEKLINILVKKNLVVFNTNIHTIIPPVLARLPT